MIRVMAHIVAIAVCAASIASCGLQGTFGFKKFGQDTYHRLDGVPEFASDETVEWAYVFKKKYGERTIGIVYQKKELVWVEMLTGTGRIDEFNRIVYGTIRDFPPGTYQIVLTDLKNDNRMIATREFVIYERDAGED